MRLRNQAMSILTTTLVFMPFAPAAFAKIDPALSQEISAACIKAGSDNPDKKKIALMCRCIAQRHFGAALKEPKESDGQKQLQWVVDYYTYSKDPKKLKRVLARPDNIEDFDIEVALGCK